MFEKALKIAITAHSGQVDKYGQPYIEHPLRVSQACKSEVERIIGILHDVVEDSDYTCDQLREEGFSEDIVVAIDCLSKRDGEDFFDYIDRVKTSPLAIKVKINDLKDNMNITRMDVITDKAVKKLKRYLKAYHILKPLS